MKKNKKKKEEDDRNPRRLWEARRWNGVVSLAVDCSPPSPLT